jgi:L-rhamnose 1-dehydrogenase
MLLKDKVVIVTGASRGIGRALAIGCAREGARVVVNYRSGPGSDVVEEIREAGGQAVPAKGDVAEPWTGKAMVQTAVETFGQVDVLVSNAGICPFHSFLDMPVDVMQRTTEVNYFGTFYAAQAAANRMVEQGTGGAIVAISSISALVGGGMQ